MKTPTYEEIKPYLEKKLISEQVHPENEDVRIFNYTQSCQFAKAWDDVTRQCRGLILNVKTGEVIARPFPKFFNYSEHVNYKWPIPNDTPVVSEKLDGSLGILYVLNGKTWIATRGSFMSEQAVWATNWFRENVEFEGLEPGLTNLFEIIFPENRIVVNYDFSGLVYLGTIENETGNTVEVNWSEPIRKAKTIPSTSIEELIKLDEPNSEGFVIYYPKENVRMKIKFPEYVRLHKIVTGVSEIGIWEMLRDNSDFAPLLEKVPDEFFKWMTNVREDLEAKFAGIEEVARNEFEEIAVSFPTTRREWAEKIQSMQRPSIGFAMLDKKDYKDIIWKMIRPHGQSIFKKDIDL